MNGIADKIRQICAHLRDAPEGSAEEAWYRAALKDAEAQLADQEKQWNKASEGDEHQDKARQVYRSREKDSANGFSEGLKLFNPKKKDSERRKKD